MEMPRMITDAARAVARAGTVLNQMKFNCTSKLARDGVSAARVSTDTPSSERRPEQARSYRERA